MKKRLPVIILALIFILTVSPLYAQFNLPPTPAFSEFLADRADENENRAEPHYADQPVDTTFKPQKPTVALFKSLFVPGLGQIGNRKYIKAGIIIALESSLIATLVHYAGETSDARDRFDAAVDVDEKSRLFQEFKDAKDKRNQFSWYTATVIFLSMFDAYVDAHLAGFPKYDEKITIEMSPDEEQNWGVRLTYRF